MNIQGWFPLGLTKGLISFQSRGLSRVFCLHIFKYIYNSYEYKFIFIQYIYIIHICIFKFCSHPSFELAIHGRVDCKDGCQQLLLNLYAQLSPLIRGWNVPLVSLNFLKRSLVFPILFFSSISLHRSLRKAPLSLLAILWNSAFKWVYLSFFPLFFTSLLFTAIYKASLDSHFAFSHFFFLGMILIPVSCTMSRTSLHSSSGTLSIRSSPLNLFLTSTV